MFDIGLGWQEMVVIAMVAIIIIGPKDLPGVLRSVGKWTRKARSLAGEFQSGLDDMVREAELDEAKKTLDTAKNFNINKAVEDAVDPTGEMKKEADSVREAAQGEPEAENKIGAASSDVAEKDADPAADEEAPKAKIIHHPAQIAPAHSIKPPPEPGEAEASPVEGETSSSNRA